MEFGESKVINGLHADEAIVGQYYYFDDDILALKETVEDGDACAYKLEEIEDGRFCTDDGIDYTFIYPAFKREFDESKVINTLHADKAVVGKKYFYADDISELKENVEGNSCYQGEYERMEAGYFLVDNTLGYLLYPVD